jgi:RpiB/LacA/LacB family sugar-phosphate isomerase
MSNTRPTFHRIAVGTDHGGYELKQRLVTFLESEGHPVMDCGTYNGDAADYPIYAGRVARAVSSGLVDAGIVLCKSGNGVAIVANRHPGVRAAWAEDAKAAALTREHNNANTLVIGSEHLRGDLIETVSAWLHAQHDPDSRHGRRVAMIDELDAIHSSALPALRLLQINSSAWLANVPSAMLLATDFNSFVEHHHLRGATVGRESLATAIEADPETWAETIKGRGLSPGDASQVVEALFREHVQMVADALAPTFKATDGDEGFVAARLPVTSSATLSSVLDDGTALLEGIDRPNVILSIPAFAEATRVIARMAESGQSLLVSDVLSAAAAHAVLEAWMGGLEERVKIGFPIHSQRLFLSVPIMDVRKASGADGLITVATALLEPLRRCATGARYRALAFSGAALPRIAWDCENAFGTEVELACALFAPLTIQIHDPVFFELPEGALDGAEHPLEKWLKDAENSLSSGSHPFTVPALKLDELILRESRASEQVVVAIGAMLTR